MNIQKAKAFRECGRKIIAVARNYREHAAEMGESQVPEKPSFFMKPTTAYITEPQEIMIPRGCKNLQHEVELGVVIGKSCSNIPPANAMECVAGYALALDMTARDFQHAAKSQKLPWFLSKGFDTSCPVSRFIDLSEVKDPQNLSLWCRVNGKVKQQGNTSRMVYTVAELIHNISQYVTLEPGDLMLTGTPSGVSTVNSGDVIECGLEGILSMRFTVQG